MIPVFFTGACHLHTPPGPITMLKRWSSTFRPQSFAATLLHVGAAGLQIVVTHGVVNFADRPVCGHQAVQEFACLQEAKWERINCNSFHMSGCKGAVEEIGRIKTKGFIEVFPDVGGRAEDVGRMWLPASLPPCQYKRQPFYTHLSRC